MESKLIEIRQLNFHVRLLALVSWIVFCPRNVSENLNLSARQNCRRFWRASQQMRSRFATTQFKQTL
jgi:hypothetical protein